MDTTTSLTPAQQSILFALLHQMIRTGEINISSLAKSDRLASPTQLDKVGSAIVMGLDAISLVTPETSRLTPFISATRKLLTDDVLLSLFYLKRQFKVDASELYFPGISLPDPVDAGDGSDGVPEVDGRAPSPRAGCLTTEFADTASRLALVSALRGWADHDPDFTLHAETTLARVSAALGIESAVAAV